MGSGRAVKPSVRERCLIQRTTPSSRGISMKLVSLVARIAPISLLLATAAHAQSSRGRGDSIFVWSARIGDGGTLTIKNIVGGISITEASGDRVEVRAEKKMRGRGDPGDIGFDVQETSSGATICTVYRGESACDEGGFNNTRFSVRYTVAMPRGLRLRASTGNGDLSVEKAGAEVELRTGNGGVHIGQTRSEEHTSELQSRQYLVCRLLLEKKKKKEKN